MVYLVPTLICLFFAVFFTSHEIAYSTANRLKIEMDKKKGLFVTRFVTFNLNRPEKYRATLLTGRVISMVSFTVFIILWSNTSIQHGIPESAFLILQIFVCASVLLLAGELLPRLIVRYFPDTALNIFSLPGFLFYLLFYPVSALMQFISRKHLKRTTNKLSSHYSFNRIELTELLNQSLKEEGESNSTANDLKLFRNALEFSSIKIRDCMVPRTEIIASEINTPIPELLQKFITSGFSKILIYQENIDNIIGYITSKTLFKKIKSIKEGIIEALFVPETMSAHRLLKKFIQEKKNLAVVVDEFGGVSGMVAIEDIIEEIFGEIEDEYDTVELIEKQINENEFIFSGRLEIEYINEKYKLNLPESEDYDTLAGYIFQYHENIPELNEEITIGLFIFKILKVSKTKIELIRLKIYSD